MIIKKELSDEVVLEELGRRIARRRLDFQFTQAQLAEQAGVSKRTVERIESGATSQMSTMIRVFRVLDLMTGLDQVVSEVKPRPMDMLKLNGTERKRASSINKKKVNRDWHWGDEA